MLSQIKSWLDNPVKNFQKGVELLKAIGRDELVIKLCEKFENSYTEEKLIDALETRFKELECENLKGNPLEATTENIKDAVIRLMAERSKLFKETLLLRQELKKTYPLLYRGQIDLSSALSIMDNRDRKGAPVPFSIVAVTYNETLGTGGEIIEFKKAQLAVMNSSNKLIEGKKAERLSNRNPNHWLNGTRNIRPYDSNQIRKINIWLILQFNEMEVNIGHIG